MKPLTPPQAHLLATIKQNGGKLRRFNFRFLDNAGKPILGLSGNTMRSLQKMGLVTVDFPVDLSMTYTLTERGRNL